VIANPDSLVSFKGIVLDLNEVGIEGGSETDYAINPTLSGEYLALESASGAAVAITNAMDAVNSENNLRFGGEGKLVSISTAEYDAKADGALFYGTSDVTIVVSADGLQPQLLDQ